MLKMENLRKAYGEALVAAGKENPNIVALEADLGKSTMSCLFEAEFPDRHFEMGIAEANMASTAAGLSLTGKIPFIHSFAVFASGRAYDPIRQSICIANLNVKICGSSCGLSDFSDGSTHQSIDDAAIMRALPNMTVLCPLDSVETQKMVRAAVRHNGPVYIRINRNDLPVYTPEAGEFEIGRPYVIREGRDAVVFACGIMVTKALTAAELLDKEGISIQVVNMSTLKSLDTDAVAGMIEKFKGVVTAEEHSVVGGLGSAISEAMAGRVTRPIEYIGVKDQFGVSAMGYEELLAAYGLTEKEIAQAVRNVLK